MNSTQYWINRAKELGFTEAAPLDPAGLQVREDVRSMCAADKCGAYGKNWTCPPACGSLEDCRQRMHSYSRGLLVQTVGHLRKDIDSRIYRETEQRHLEQLRSLAREVRAVHPEALCLGAGGCRVCRQCSYPQPCRFPGEAMASMEGYGLFVTQVCRDAGLAYHHGNRTVTYSGCFLF